MKHLKRFEGFFYSKPKQISSGEWNERLKLFGKDFFEKDEQLDLINLMEESGREHMQTEEWDNLGWSEKIDNYNIGATYVTFYLPSHDEEGGNPHPYEVHIQKCKDDWFLISYYQEDWDGDEEYHDGYEEYYECTGFDSLLDFLNSEIGNI